MDWNNITGTYGAALKLRETRAGVLAQNLANIDTPQYKARDIDFQSALQKATSKMQVGATLDQGQIGASAELKYRVPNQPDLGDGNTVDGEVEKIQFADNAMQYQANLMLLSRRFQGIQSALRGE